MVKTISKLTQIAAILFVILIFGYGIYRVSSFDLSAKQSYAELLARVSVIADASGATSDKNCFEKVSFNGCVIRFFSDKKSDALDATYAQRAYEKNWRLIHRENIGDTLSVLYCDRSASIKMELRDDRAGTSVRIGIYWAANPASDRYCREKGGAV